MQIEIKGPLTLDHNCVYIGGMDLEQILKSAVPDAPTVSSNPRGLPYPQITVTVETDPQ